MKLAIREDNLTARPVLEMLQAHLAHSERHSPETSRHSLVAEELSGPDVTFWTGWVGDAAAVCGALKKLDPVHGEVKSMHTVERFRGNGFAALMLQHIIDTAIQQGFGRLSLETGSMDAYAPARALYARFGFASCLPFAGYNPDPYSEFMTLNLQHRR